MSKALSLIATAAALFAAAPAQAQDAYPTRPIKIIVCLPAGGGVDTVTRIIADKLPKILGQPEKTQLTIRSATRRTRGVRVKALSRNGVRMRQG